MGYKDQKVIVDRQVRQVRWDHLVQMAYQESQDLLVREGVPAKEDARAREENRVSRSCKVYDAYTVSRDDLVASA